VKLNPQITGAFFNDFRVFAPGKKAFQAGQGDIRCVTENQWFDAMACIGGLTRHTIGRIGAGT
jgi:hypothetical protein